MQKNPGERGSEENRGKETTLLSFSLDLSLVCACFYTPVHNYFNITTGDTKMQKYLKRKQRKTKKRGRERRRCALFKLRYYNYCGSPTVCYSPFLS
jgi:hypothetical protein